MTKVTASITGPKLAAFVDAVRTLSIAAFAAECSEDKPAGSYCTVDNPTCELHVASDVVISKVYALFGIAEKKRA